MYLKQVPIILNIYIINNWMFMFISKIHLKRRLLKVPWTARSNQSVLKEINPEYSLERVMLKRSSNTSATWCEEVIHWKTPWCWVRLKAGEGDNRGWDSWMASLIYRTWVLANSGRWWRTVNPGMLQSMGLQRVKHDWGNEQPPPRI